MDELTESEEIKPEPVSSRPPVRNKLDILAPLALVIPLFIYYKTLCPVVFYGDSGELLTAAKVGGLAFPTGYPAYLISLTIFLRLPLQWLMPNLDTIDPLAWQGNFLSSIFGAVTCYVLYQFLKRITRMPLAAFGGALVFAFSKTFWQQSLIAEVYSLNAMLTTLILYLDLRTWEAKTGRYVIIRWLIQGIALANHPMSLFFIPLGLYTTGIYLLKSADPKKTKVLLKAFGAVLLGLALYLYLPIMSSFDPPLDYENPETLTNFWNVVSRATYSTGFSRWQGDAEGLNSFELARSYLGWSLENLGLVIHLLAIIGLFAIFIERDVWRGLKVGLMVSSFLLLIFFWSYYMGVSSYDLQFMEVYYIPNHLIMVVLSVLGIGFLSKFLFRNGGKENSVFVLIAGFVMVLTAVGVGIINYNKSDRSQNLIAHYYLEDIARTIPSEGNNILITDGDDIFLLWYLKYARNEIQNTVLVGRDTFFSQENWYWDWIRKEEPDLIIPDPIQIAELARDDKSYADKLFLIDLFHKNIQRYNLLFIKYSQDVQMETIDQSIIPIQRGILVQAVPNGMEGEGIYLDEDMLNAYNLDKIIALDEDSFDFYEEELYNRYTLPVYSYGKFLVMNRDLERGIDLYAKARYFLKGLDNIEFSAMIKNDIGLGYLDAAMATKDRNLKAEHYSRALEIFTELSGQFPGSAIYHAHLARLHFFFGDIEQAQYELESAIELDPENPLLMELARSFSGKEDENSTFVFD